MLHAQQCLVEHREPVLVQQIQCPHVHCKTPQHAPALYVYASRHNASHSYQVWMNGVDKRLKMSLKEDVFQTWNPLIEPEPRHVVVRMAWTAPENPTALTIRHAARFLV